MSEKLRVHTLAMELGVASRQIIERAREDGTGRLNNHMSVVSAELAVAIRRWFKDSSFVERKRKAMAASVPQTLRVHSLAKELGVASKQIIGRARQQETTNLKNHMSVVSPDLAVEIRKWFKDSSLVEHKRPRMAPSQLAGFFDLVERVEITTMQAVLRVLRAADRERWWYELVPQPIRIECAKRQEEEKGIIEYKHAYLSFIDLKTIIKANWSRFEPMFRELGDSRGKDRTLAWMDEFNKLRRLFGHPLKAHIAQRRLSDAEIAFLKDRLEYVHRLYDAAQPSESG